MLRVLLLKANDGNAAVATNILMCLGELTCVGGEDTMPHVPELMQVIMARLSDPSLAKRDAALHALGQICGSTGYVITPLVDYPQLLPALGRIVRTDPTKDARREVMKVLGILGALDPFRRMVLFEYSGCSISLKACASRPNSRWKPRMRCPLRPSTLCLQGMAVHQHLMATI